MELVSALSGVYDVVNVTQAKQLSAETVSATRPLLVFVPNGVPYADVEQALSSLSRSAASILLVTELSPGDGTTDTPNPLPDPSLVADGQARAACSGHLAPEARSAIAELGVAYLGEEVLGAAKFRVIEEGLCATQTVLGAEAAALCNGLGVDGELFCRAIGTAAGASWVLRNLVPRMLGLTSEPMLGQTFDEAQKALAASIDLSFKDEVYSPLTAIAAQMFALAASKADTSGSSAQVSVLWGLDGATSHKGAAPLPSVQPMKPRRVGVIGLGAMGFGMANVLQNSGLDVRGYDAYAPTVERFTAGGGHAAASPAECADAATVLVFMVVSAAQAREVLFEQGAAKALAPDAVVLLMITSAPSDAIALSQELASVRPDVRLIDAPVSGSKPRAEAGDLTILAGGLESCGELAAAHALYVLRILSGTQGRTDNLIVIPGGVGAGMSVKMLNQHQGAAFLMTSAEALAQAQRAHLPLRTVRKLLLEGPAQTWMMWHRGKNMLDGLLQPPSAMIDILNKDLRIVILEARNKGVSLPLLALVQQQFVLGRANGWGADDDSSLARLWLSSGIDIKTPEASCDGGAR